MELLVSHRHKFAFIHIAKTGGLAIEDALSAYSDLGGYRDAARQHIPAWQLLNTVIGNAWEDYYTFAVTRNPWEITHSRYHFLRNIAHFPTLNGFALDVLLAKQCSFPEYVQQHIQLGFMTADPVRSAVVDKADKILVTDIIEYRELAQRWPEICERCGVPVVELPRKNVTEGRPDYRSEYDAVARQLIAERDAWTIERFGYEF